ncbi:MAG: ORF6C domain-containing protein [Parcubacteria group bacterium]
MMFESWFGRDKKDDGIHVEGATGIIKPEVKRELAARADQSNLRKKTGAWKQKNLDKSPTESTGPGEDARRFQPPEAEVAKVTTETVAIAEDNQQKHARGAKQDTTKKDKLLNKPETGPNQESRERGAKLAHLVSSYSRDKKIPRGILREFEKRIAQEVGRDDSSISEIASKNFPTVSLEDASQMTSFLKDAVLDNIIDKETASQLVNGVRAAARHNINKRGKGNAEYARGQVKEDLIQTDRLRKRFLRDIEGHEEEVAEIQTPEDIAKRMETLEWAVENKRISRQEANKQLALLQAEMDMIEEVTEEGSGIELKTRAEAAQEIRALELAVRDGVMSRLDADRQIHDLKSRIIDKTSLEDDMAAVERGIAEGRISLANAKLLYKKIKTQAAQGTGFGREETQIDPRDIVDLDQSAARGMPSLPDDTGEVELSSDEFVDLPAGDRSAMKGMPPLPASTGSDATVRIKGLAKDESITELGEDDIDVESYTPEAAAEAKAQLEKDMDADRITYKEYAQKLLAINKSTTEKLAKKSTKTTTTPPPISADATDTGVSKVSITDKTMVGDPLPDLALQAEYTPAEAATALQKIDTQQQHGTISQEVAVKYQEQIAANTTEELNVTDMIEITPAEGTRIETVLTQVKTGEITPEEGVKTLTMQVEEATKKVDLSAAEKTRVFNRITEDTPAPVELAPLNNIFSEEESRALSQIGNRDQGAAAGGETGELDLSSSGEYENPFDVAVGAVERVSTPAADISEQETTELFRFIDNRVRTKAEISPKILDRTKSKALAAEKMASHQRAIDTALEREKQKDRLKLMESQEFRGLIADLQEQETGGGLEEAVTTEITRAAGEVVKDQLDTTNNELVEQLASAKGPKEVQAAMDKFGNVYPIVGKVVEQLNPEYLAAMAKDDVGQAFAAEVVDEVRELYDPRSNGESLRAKLAKLDRQFQAEGLSREDTRQGKDDLLQAIEASTGVNLMDMKSEKMMTGLNERGRYEPLSHSPEEILKQLIIDINAVGANRKVAKEARQPSKAEVRKELGIQPVFVTEAVRRQIRKEGFQGADAKSLAETERFLELRTEKIEPREIGSYVLSGRISPEAAEHMLALEEGKNEAVLAKARRRIEVVKHEEFERAKEAAYAVMEKAGVSQAEWSELDNDIEGTLASIESLEGAGGDGESRLSKIVPLFLKGRTRKKNAELKAHDAHLARLLLRKAKLEKKFIDEVGESALSQNDTKRLAEYGFFRSIAGEDDEQLGRNLDIISGQLKDNVLAVEGVDLAKDAEALDQAMAELKRSSRVIENRKKEIQHARNVANVVDFMNESGSRRYKDINFNGRQFLQAYRDARRGKDPGKYSTMEQKVFESADKMQRKTLDRLFKAGRAPEAQKKAA